MLAGDSTGEDTAAAVNPVPTGDARTVQDILEQYIHADDIYDKDNGLVDGVVRQRKLSSYNFIVPGDSVDRIASPMFDESNDDFGMIAISVLQRIDQES